MVLWFESHQPLTQELELEEIKLQNEKEDTLDQVKDMVHERQDFLQRLFGSEECVFCEDC